MKVRGVTPYSYLAGPGRTVGEVGVRGDEQPGGGLHRRRLPQGGHVLVLPGGLARPWPSPVPHVPEVILELDQLLDTGLGGRAQGELEQEEQQVGRQHPRPVATDQWRGSEKRQLYRSRWGKLGLDGPSDREIRAVGNQAGGN